MTPSVKKCPFFSKGIFLHKMECVFQLLFSIAMVGGYCQASGVTNILTKVGRMHIKYL
jgi:hypothetical protein